MRQILGKDLNVISNIGIVCIEYWYSEEISHPKTLNAVSNYVKIKTVMIYILQRVESEDVKDSELFFNISLLK